MRTGVAVLAVMLVTILSCCAIGTALGLEPINPFVPPATTSNGDQVSVKQTTNAPALAASNNTRMTHLLTSSTKLASLVGAASPICPAPLIVDPNWAAGGSQVPHCNGGCCVPCPMEYSYYPTGTLELGFRITTFTRSFSGICMIFLVISFLVLPGKRRPPSTLILYSSVGVAVFSLVGLFAAKDPKTIQCADAITKSTMHNNSLCAIQGGLLIFGSFASCVWVSVIILNLHMHTVWNKDVLMHRYTWLSLAVWGYVVIFTVLPLALGEVQFEFGELCLVHQKTASSLFFYPLGIFVFPSVILHLWTCVCIIRIKSRTFKSHPDRFSSQSSSLIRRIRQRQTVLQTFRLQWRAMLLALALSVSLAFYWLFYFIEISRLEGHHSSRDSQQARSWFVCVMKGLGQDACAPILEDQLPSHVMMIVAEFSVSFPGTLFFIIFGVQRRIYQEWCALLARCFGRNYSANHPLQHGVLDSTMSKWMDPHSPTMSKPTGRLTVPSAKPRSPTFVTDFSVLAYSDDDRVSARSLEAAELSSDTDTAEHPMSETMADPSQRPGVSLHSQPVAVASRLYYPLSSAFYSRQPGPRFGQLARAVSDQFPDERLSGESVRPPIILLPPPPARVPGERIRAATPKQNDEPRHPS